MELEQGDLMDAGWSPNQGSQESSAEKVTMCRSHLEGSKQNLQRKQKATG